MTFNISKSRSSIGKNSDNNLVIQNSTINHPVIIDNSGTSQILNLLGGTGNYDHIQQFVSQMLESAQKTHPLSPQFSASYDSKLKKLVSTPETDNAFKDHPKIIKGTYQIDYSKYPYMHKDETPWSYAYRTQTRVEMDTLSYKEFLGDMEDPFPVLTYTEGMKTIIGAPEFPAAVEAQLISGKISIPIMLRRLPCMEFGVVVFGNTSPHNGFQFKLFHHLSSNRIDINIKKNHNCTLESELLREQFLLEMAVQKDIRIHVSGNELYSGKLNDSAVQTDIFKLAPIFYDYYNALIKIRNYTGFSLEAARNCKSVPESDYKTAILMASSLEGGCVATRSSYNEIDVDCSNINDNFFDQSDVNEFNFESLINMITLSQYEFKSDKIVYCYKNARISNLGAIKRAIKQKRSHVTFKIKPADGFEKFITYTKIYGLRAK